MNYKVFLIRANTNIFLFNFEQQIQLRPKVGDVLTNPFTFQEFKILRDEINVLDETIFRITDGLDFRITDDGDFRVIQEGIADIEFVTHNYFVTPANNPNRIASWSTNTFDDDQTLRQLFR